MIVKLIREGLGRIIILGDVLTRPKAIERSTTQQAEVDSAVGKMALYQFYACPFCTKTRRAMHRLALPIEIRDAQKNTTRRSELEAGGGRIKVPCLRIENKGEVQWMYDSNAIIAYLDQQFGAQA